MQVAPASDNVLLIQFADIGDLLLAAPAIQHLRESHPGSRLSLLTKPTNAELAERLADHVITLDKHVYDAPRSLLAPSRLWELIRLIVALRRQRFGQVVLLHHLVTRWGSLKLALLTLAIGARCRMGIDDGRAHFLTRSIRDRGFGVRRESDYWGQLLGGQRPPPLPMNHTAAADLLAQHGVSRPFMVVHPGSGWYSAARRWPLQRWGQMIDVAVAESGLDVVVVGGAEETELGDELVRGREAHVASVAGRTDLATLAGILAAAEVFVGNDGGVAQLAAALVTPSVVVFGPTDPTSWGPQHEKSRIVRLDLACSPCFYRYHELGTPQGCSTRECLTTLAVERVLEAVRDVLRQARAA